MKAFKKLLIFFFFFCSCNHSKAQMFSSLGIGYSTKGSAISNLAIGYNKGLFNLQGQVIPSLTRKVEQSNLLGFRLSLNLINPDSDGLSILPGVGYYYNHKSSDKRMLNTWQLGYSLKSSIEVTETGALFIEGMYVEKDIELTIGMQVNFK